MKLAKKYIFIFLIIITISLEGCSDITNSTYSCIEKGELDLRQWDFHTDGNINLDGEWEFYWNKFVMYKDLEEEKPDLFASVPNIWNRYILNGADLPSEGYATYRLHITTDLPKGTMLGVSLLTFSSAYSLYINENMVASNGRVAATASEEVGEYRPQAVFFPIPASEFDMIMHVSNFHYARGGFWDTVRMGLPEDVLNHHDIMMGKEIFLLGALVIVALFFAAIFILMPELKYTLYFSLLCIVMAVAIDMVGQLIIPRLFPGLNLHQVVMFMWYTSTTWILICLILYVHELYRSRFSGMVLKAFLAIAGLLQLSYVFSSPAYYSKFGYINDCMIIVGVLCTVIIVAIGIKKSDKTGWLNIISMFIALVTFIHDILYWDNFINNDFGEVFYVSLFIFMFIQMIIQAQRIKMFREQETAAQLVFLQAQIKPHFLFNALNTILAVSHYDTDKARNLLTDFSNYLRRTIDVKDMSQFAPLIKEIELAKAYIEIQKARFEERIEVTFEVPEDDLGARVPILMLQPLIENAIIHGILPRPEGGRVDVLITKVGRTLVFSVKDNGVGMAPVELKGILKHASEEGVGLTNIDTRLRKLFGKGLNIHSSQETGTEITWNVPVDGRWLGLL